MAITNWRITKTPGPAVTINCPACDEKSIPAESLRQVDQLEFFYTFPFFELRNTFITCSACQKQLLCSAPFEALDGISVEDISWHLVKHVSIVNKLLAVLSVLLCWTPIVGLMVGLLSLAVNWRTTGWTKTCSYIGVGVATAITVIILILMVVMESTGNG